MEKYDVHGNMGIKKIIMSRESDIQNICKQIRDNCFPNYDPNRELSANKIMTELWGELVHSHRA